MGEDDSTACSGPRAAEIKRVSNLNELDIPPPEAPLYLTYAGPLHGPPRWADERPDPVQRLREAERLLCLGQVAAGVAHEINNPAHWVLMNLGHLQKRLPLLLRLWEFACQQPDSAGLCDGELRDLLMELPSLIEQSLTGMRRIRDIVRDLRIFAREDQEAPQPVNLNEVCDLVASMAWPELRRHARLEKSYGVVPPCLGQRGKLSQVLMNLVVNAMHAIPEGEPQRHRLVLRTAQVGDEVLVAVRDTGCGVPAELRERIFEPYFSTKPAGLGTGLGLALSLEIVRGHGGRITLESAPGEGSTFTVWLPVAPAHRQRQSPTRPIRARPSLPLPEAAPARRPRVLLVDDEPEILRSVGRLLRGSYEVRTAGSVQEGLRVLDEQGAVDLVLCDMMMPDEPGTELYRRLPRALQERLVFLSGDVTSERVRRFLEQSGCRCVAKPVEPEVLRRLVAEAVRGAVHGG